jgi:hypothetical protein
MYRIRYIGSQISWFIVYTCIFLTGINALGMEPSDAELLRTAIAKYKSNIERIMTWQGKVIGELYENGSPPASDKVEFLGKPIKISEIFFSDDIVTGDSHCIHHVLRNYNTEFHDEICTFFFFGRIIV